MFWSFHPLAVKTDNEHLPKPFFKVIWKSLYRNKFFFSCLTKLLVACLDLRWNNPRDWCISSQYFDIGNTSLLVCYITSQCVDISEIQSLLLAFDIQYYISIVAYPSPVISRCLDIRWNTSRVWYITYRCLDIRWNTPSRIWCITSQYLDTTWNTPSRVDILLIGVLISNETLLIVFDILLLVILVILLCLNIRWNTSILLVNMLA